MAERSQSKGVGTHAATHHGSRLSHHTTRYALEERPFMHFLRNLLVVFGLVLAVFGIWRFVLAVHAYTSNTPHEDSVEETYLGDHRDILLLMSYDDNHLTVPFMRSGIVDTLEPYDITLDIEYLRTKVYPLGTPASNATLAALAEKLATRTKPYDVIIVADDDALTVVEEGHDTIFGGSPVVFLGINDHPNARRIAQQGWLTGVLEINCYDEMMEFMEELMPDLHHLLILVDDTSTGRGDLEQFMELKPLHPELTYEVLSSANMTFSQMRDRVRQLEAGSVAIQLDTYLDYEGTTFTVEEAASFFSDGSPVPLFRGNIGGVGDGVCLSAYSDYREAGEQAAHMALQVAAGTKPSDIPLSSDSALGVTVDAREFARFGLSLDKLPDTAIIVNKTSDDSRRLQSPITLPLTLLLASLAAFLGSAFISYTLSRADAEALSRTGAELDFELTHDHLTGLPNRHALDEYLSDTPDDPSPARALVKVDLDDFADINDTYGSAIGDAVIKALSKRARQINSAFTARAGGDEFVFVFDEPLNPDNEELLHILNVFSMPVEVDGSQLSVGASIGIVLSVDETEVSELMLRADLAVRQAKAVNGKREFRIYEDYMSEEFARTTLITSSIRHALDGNGVIALYQPQVDSVTHTVYGFEALCRLEGSAFGPAEFIPIAEKSGLIIELGRRMAYLVVRQQSTWAELGLPPRVVSINFSAGQLLDLGYVAYLRALLSEYNVPANLIKIEVTESMMLEDVDRAKMMIKELKHMGVNIALDDFGTGYSSFDRLTYDAIDFVKFDKSFTDHFLNPAHETVVHNMTRLLHDLGKHVVMEGVETREQVDACIRLGCDFIQGYYFAQPLNPDDIPTWTPRT